MTALLFPGGLVGIIFGFVVGRVWEKAASAHRAVKANKAARPALIDTRAGLFVRTLTNTFGVLIILLIFFLLTLPSWKKG
jgi:hypothetical protein